MSEIAINEMVASGWQATRCRDARGRAYVHLKHEATGAWMDVYRVSDHSYDAAKGG